VKDNPGDSMGDDGNGVREKERRVLHLVYIGALFGSPVALIMFALGLAADAQRGRPVDLGALAWCLVAGALLVLAIRQLIRERRQPPT
jgi:Ca2+/Na+ antiporter